MNPAIPTTIIRMTVSKPITRTTPRPPTGWREHAQPRHPRKNARSRRRALRLGLSSSRCERSMLQSSGSTGRPGELQHDRAYWSQEWQSRKGSRYRFRGRRDDMQCSSWQCRIDRHLCGSYKHRQRSRRLRVRQHHLSAVYSQRALDPPLDPGANGPVNPTGTITYPFPRLDPKAEYFRDLVTNDPTKGSYWEGQPADAVGVSQRPMQARWPLSTLRAVRSVSIRPGTKGCDSGTGGSSYKGMIVVWCGNLQQDDNFRGIVFNLYGDDLEETPNAATRRTVPQRITSASTVTTAHPAPAGSTPKAALIQGRASYYAKQLGGLSSGRGLG